MGYITEYEQVLMQGRAALHKQVDALLGTKKREDREMTAAENERLYALMDLIADIDHILDKRDERRRQARIAAGLPVPPREIIVVRRVGPPLRKQKRTCRKPRARIRRAAPLVTRIRRTNRARPQRRAASARSDANDPDPEPGRVLARFVKSRAWRLLDATGRREIIALINGDLLTPQAMAAIDAVFQQSAINRNEHPGPGVLWFGLPFPVCGLLVRNAGGLFTVLAFDPDSSFGDDWETRGSA